MNECFLPRRKEASRAKTVGRRMTISDETQLAAERKRRRHKVARRLYEQLVAQDPNRVITLCDDKGNVVDHHNPFPKHDAPEIAPATASLHNS